MDNVVTMFNTLTAAAIRNRSKIAPKIANAANSEVWQLWGAIAAPSKSRHTDVVAYLTELD